MTELTEAFKEELIDSCQVSEAFFWRYRWVCGHDPSSWFRIVSLRTAFFRMVRSGQIGKLLREDVDGGLDYRFKAVPVNDELVCTAVKLTDSLMATFEVLEREEAARHPEEVPRVPATAYNTDEEFYELVKDSFYLLLVEGLIKSTVDNETEKK